MILSTEELKRLVPTIKSDDCIRFQLEAIEAVIRAYTNNPFQVRSARFSGRSAGGSAIIGGLPVFMRPGDTVQLSGGTVNDGLYVIRAVLPEGLTLDRELEPAEEMTVTKVYYPADVVQCALRLFEWKENLGDKVGIRSETLSRYSVTYDSSTDSLFLGYPLAILSGLKLHRKARC